MTNKERIQEHRKWLEREKGKQQQLLQAQIDTKKEIKLLGKDLRRHEQAREVIKEVGIKTQEKLQFHISDITSLALDAVFPEPYKLVAEFVERRNKTECDLFFSRNDEKISPLIASGGGAVDVASFALRIASWSMEMPKSRNTIILDEPFHFLSESYQPQAGAILKELSEKLGVQLIIVTHEKIITEYAADKVFNISIKKGKSFIKK